MMKVWLSAGLLVGMLLISSCSSVTGVSMESQESSDGSVVFENRSMSNQLVFIAVEEVIHRKVGNLLQAQTTVRNTSTFEIEVKYQFRFFDKDGFTVGEDTRPWTSITLQGKDSKQIKALAPNPTATTVKVYIQK